jgi:uncharacterized protein involved in exopolysaccharide biosynthesis
VFDLDDDIQEGSRQESGPGTAPRFGRPVEIGRLVRALLRQRWVILAGAIIGVAAGVVIAKTIIPRVYVTETSLVWESEDGDEPNIRELRTVVDSVKLPTNLAEVRERLAIDQRLDQLAARIDVRFDRDSDLVILRAESDDPEDAVALCETIIEVFLDHQRGIAAERLDEEVESLEGDVARARERLGTAQNRYDEFRSEHGVSDLSIERQQAIELAASLRAQADIARADSEAAEARGSSGRSRRPHSSESADLRHARQRLETARARLSEDHPRVQALSAEVDALRAAEATAPHDGTDTARAHAQRTRAAAQRRHEAYERMEREARERLEELSSVEGEASSLLASVRVAEGHVADVEGELAVAQDRARDASSGFRVLAAPLMPVEPERSYRKPAAIAIPIAFVILVMLVILAIELRGLRVKTANELAYWGRAPVVASTTWPSKKRELAAIVDELAEKAAAAGGRTLVIAASELDQSVADDVAEHLKVSVSVNVADAQADTAYYDAEGRDLVTAPPSDAPGGLLTAGETGTDIVIDESGKMVKDEREAPRPRRQNVPALAKREQKTIARRRGRRLERVQVSKDQIYLDPETSPAEIVASEAGSGDAFVRRGARAADRVLVVVRSGAMSVTKASELRALVGRQDEGVAFLLVNVPDWLAVLADQAGPVNRFWRSTRDA